MELRVVLDNPRFFVEFWANKRKSVKSTDLNTLFLDYSDEIRAYNYAHRDDKKLIRMPLKHLIESAFAEYLNNQPKLRRAEIAKTLTVGVEDLEPITQWVKAVTGACKPEDLYVMAHWLWLVKRNMNELPVIHHIMPIVVSSKQGGGKSTAIKNLIKPFNELTLELKVPQIVDERSFTMFSNYLIGFLDELAGSDKVDISDFKRNVTSSTLTYRPMRTNQQERVDNFCSFISASNMEAYDSIKDTTGLRRFFQINALEKLDWATINAIDYVKLWKGIDERKERGYFEPVQVIVNAKQEDMQMQDEVKLFLEAYDVMPKDGKVTTINGKHLYREYIFHTKNEGIRFPVAAQTFYKKLRSMGIEGAKKRDDNKIICWFFDVNSNVASLLKENISAGN